MNLSVPLRFWGTARGLGTILLLALTLSCLLPDAQGQTTNSPSTVAPKQNCSSRGSECGKCVEDVSCYFCQTENACRPYPGSRILPNKECPLSDTRWAVCWLNFEALIIAVSVLGGVLLITVSCCIYCCCCRTSSSSVSKRWARDEKKSEQKREELRLKHEERRADRKAKNDEIRKKYGLVKDDNPYMKFENDKP